MIDARDFLRGKKAVVFDFDGTLGDTLGLWNDVDVRLARELGYPDIDPQECHAFREEALRRHRNEENPYRAYCGDLVQKLGSTLTAAEIHARRFQISRRVLDEEVRLQPGAAAFLKRLRAMGFAMAVATTTRRANIEIYSRTNKAIRSEIHLEEVFEGFVCAEDVDHIKPDPECYVKALSLLGVAAHETFAVEDTVAGVQAARGAGLAVIGMAEPHSAADADTIRAMTDLYFEDYAAFSAWLD